MRKIKNTFRHDEIESHAGPERAAALPVYSIEQISNYLTKGYWKDQDPDWGPRSWDKSVHPTITYNIDALSEPHKELARLAFATWDEIIGGLSFTEDTSGGISSQIDFTANTGGSYESDNAPAGGKISFATINIDPSDPDTHFNSTLTETYIHEIGHALGLGHGGDYNGTSGSGPHYRNDTRQFSIMSYVAQGNFNGASSLDVLTPQMADIYAVIKKYGAADIRETDTIYGNNASGLTAETGKIYDFDSSGFDFNDFGPALTIVDTGGIDTLDFSKFWADEDGMRIDLRGGRFSDIGQWEGNVGIYITTVIENAFGGVDSDIMTGNKVANSLDGGAGEDKLSGLQGNDLLTGGADIDTFIYARKFDRDSMLDFENGVDHLDLSGLDIKFGRIKKLARDVGDDLILNFGHGDTLTMADFTKGEFDRTDVLL